MTPTRVRASLAMTLFLAIPSALLAQSAKPAGAARAVRLTAGDDMRFSPAEIDAKPGERLRVSLHVTSTMPKAAMSHNFVVLRNAADATALTTAAASASTTGYFPAAYRSKVIAVTPLAGGGDTVEVEFTAPRAPGRYVFLCTFPGHYQAGMKGTLVVK